MNLLLPEDFGPVAIAGLYSSQEFGPERERDQGEEDGESSVTALVVILFLAVATALLIRSMSKRLRKLPDTFDDRDLHGNVRGPEPDGSTRAE